jgi:hypothetical protein
MVPVTRKALATLVLLASLGAPVAADVVVLQNGARLEGRVVSLDDRQVLLEQTSPAGTAVVSFPRGDVRSIELGPAAASQPPPVPAPQPAAPAGPREAVRDEWWLLRADGAVRGTRHLLLVPHEDAHGSRWRLEEHVRLFAAPKVPGVRVERIEDVDEEWRPRHLHYRELGDAAAEEGGLPGYETIRSGPVAGGAWRLVETGAGAREASLPLPPGTTTPLALRESLARARPRRAKMAEVPLLDVARARVRTVLAGFSRLEAREGERVEDVMRVEDGARALESRWVAGDPPRCVAEEVTGFLATPSTKAQAEAAAQAEGRAPPAAPPGPEPGPGDAPVPATGPKAPATPRAVTVADPGLSIPVPGASWTVETPPPPTDDSGRRVLAKLWSPLHAADVRVEWEPISPRAPPGPKDSPAGAVPAPPPAPEPDAAAALLARLRKLSPDLAVVSQRNAVPSLPGAWRMTLSGTRNGERVRTLVMVAERGAGRVTVLATCPESAWADARTALESVVSGFRWL